MEEGEGATGLICSGSDPERAGRQRRVGSRGAAGIWIEEEQLVGPGGIPRKPGGMAVQWDRWDKTPRI